jgi:hypothetical protein
LLDCSADEIGDGLSGHDENDVKRNQFHGSCTPRSNSPCYSRIGRSAVRGCSTRLSPAPRPWDLSRRSIHGHQPRRSGWHIGADPRPSTHPDLDDRQPLHGRDGDTDPVVRPRSDL